MVAFGDFSFSDIDVEDSVDVLIVLSRVEEFVKVVLDSSIVLELLLCYY